MLHEVVLESGNCSLKVEWFQENTHVEGKAHQKRKCNSFHVVLPGHAGNLVYFLNKDRYFL